MYTLDEKSRDGRDCQNRRISCFGFKTVILLLLFFSGVQGVLDSVRARGLGLIFNLYIKLGFGCLNVEIQMGIPKKGPKFKMERGYTLNIHRKSV